MPSLDEAFMGFKGNLELSETLQSAITTHHTAVRSHIESVLPGIRTQLIGSLQKQTRIQPRPTDKFDIDILLVLGRFTAWAPGGVTPEGALSQAHSLLADSQRYGQMNPTVDHPTVGFDYADGINVEIVPAYEDHIGFDPQFNTCLPIGRGYWIATPHGWVHADYDHDASVLTAKNAEASEMLVPLIKMLKAIKRVHFPEMKSFHVEILAALWIPLIIPSMASVGLPVSYPSLLQQFFAWTQPLLNTPVMLPESNSPKIALTQVESTSLKGKFLQVSNMLRWIESLSTESDKIRAWRNLVGDVFPAS